MKELKDKLMTFISMLHLTIKVEKREYTSDAHELVNNALSYLDNKNANELLNNTHITISQIEQLPISKGK